MTWRAYLDESFDAGAFGVRLQLADVHDTHTVFLMADGSLMQVSEVELGMRLDEQTGISLPRDPEALRAIAEALSHHVPAQAEMRRLEENLHHERARLDRLIDRLI